MTANRSLYIWVSNFSGMFWKVKRLPFLRITNHWFTCFNNIWKRQLTHLDFIGQFSTDTYPTRVERGKYYFHGLKQFYFIFWKSKCVQSIWFSVTLRLVFRDYLFWVNVERKCLRAYTVWRFENMYQSFCPNWFCKNVVSIIVCGPFWR